MKKYIFSLTRKIALLGLTGLFVLNISAWVQDESLSPGINRRFKQQPDISIKQFDSMALHSVEQQKEILDACELKPGMDVADIGAGSGVHTRIFAGQVLPGGKVYAVDIIQEFLDHIDATCRDKEIKNVICVLGSATSCNLEPSSVDVAFCCDTYHHFEYPYKMMASIRKALRPNGKFVIIDFKDKSSHVRADSKTVIEEITKSGFRLIESRDFSNMFFLARFAVHFDRRGVLGAPGSAWERRRLAGSFLNAGKMPALPAGRPSGRPYFFNEEGQLTAIVMPKDGSAVNGSSDTPDIPKIPCRVSSPAN